MEQSRKSGAALRRLTLAVLWRRKWASLLLAAVAALGVFVSVALYGLAARQEAAMAATQRDTIISCVVTDPQGTGSGDLRMPLFWVDKLTGQRNTWENDLTGTVKNVRAKASMSLTQPSDTELRRILNFASDSALAPMEGAVIELLEGWTEEVFQTDARVCLISEEIWAEPDENGILWVTVEADDSMGPSALQVIGTVSNGPGGVIWCPLYIQRKDGTTENFFVDSCSFDITDNTRLEESKAELYETFVKPDRSNRKTDSAFGVLVQDETYLATMEEFRSNLSLLQMLLPVLTVLCGGISFFAAYLSTRGRVREFAIMRSLGMKRRRVFLQVFEEQALLMAAGALVGGLAGLLLEGGFSGGALVRAGLNLAVFLAGAAAAVGSMIQVNVMKLMKTEE